jgi:hypothetical protein
VDRVELRALYAGTDLEVGQVVKGDEGKGEFVVKGGSVSEVEGGGRTPPERKEGQRERSSGREVPVDEDGERWDKIAAAFVVGWREYRR